MTGTVQGVGFRPFVFRVASALGLGGWVSNDEHGVLLEAEGAADAVAALVERLATEPPPLAVVEAVLAEDVALAGVPAGFAIAPSARGGAADVPVAADAATCPACLAELLDPDDRRHRYPFTNCTACGPRFTIGRDVPYDRPLTTMAGFAMCPACRAEYEDPGNRRFHAQPNACPACGPRARIVAVTASHPPGLPGGEDDPVAAAAALLRTGSILAVKGLGGYHLCCRADDEAVVARLRARKHREDKPFALLVADRAAAEALVALDAHDAELLTSARRPIVLARRRSDAAVAPSVAPGAADLGVMLPYTPLHHLLARDAGTALVLTSGNVSDEPIAYRDEDALVRLAPLVEAFLLHDRPIHMRTDDSVIRSVAGGPALLMRRSRGYVPEALALPAALAGGPDALGCGAELKNTFCLASRGRAWLGHHVGDLVNAETLASFGDGIAHFERLFAVRPGLVACDRHPDYRATVYAHERDGVELVSVQHHHAHLAAVLAEHGVLEPAVGAIFDGTGLGDDGTVWGGEILVGDLAGCARAAHLWPVRLPGGDRAAREPWRMACAWLVALGAGPPDLPVALRGRVDPGAWRAVARMAADGFNAPVTTSMGRLFDAVAALCGLRAVATYEGQAAMELEAVADASARGGYELGRGLDARPLIRRVVDDVAAGVAPGVVSMRVHRGLAAATAVACAQAASAHGLERVVLSGGVFQNRVLLELTSAELTARGLRVLRPERLPPNDGGIAFGQVAVALTTAT